ncbi:MAG TPA: HAMP domain-containing sensor histidine kinase [Flavobacteriales bacterium]|nr:HAMP domain-containing sensor histidine kinase [Flavobacteriales bacterium]HPH82996.1 HAMP domain-containing sensor histidine kinase [Flavobacteriales bacterium]
MAVIIISVSLWYTNVLVKKVSTEERKKVELWADAVRNRAELVKYTESLFDRLKTEERKRAEIWAEATQNLSITEDDDARSFYLKVVSENNTIPAIIVDQQNRVNYITNADTTGFGKAEFFTGKVKAAFSAHRPIVIDDGFSNTFFIYYQDSRVFSELREVLDNIIKSFISEVVVNSASVPVIVVDKKKTRVIASGNLDSTIIADTTAMLKLTTSMASENTPLEIELPDYGKCSIYYQGSFLLTQLKYYPVIQFTVIALFMILAYFLFNFSRRAEQNQVWVGMSKETAHQLGTPLSSLIAWIEILRMKGIDEETLGEMGKDIKRLEIITERFSKIGSKPELKTQDLQQVLEESISYMRPRTSRKINIDLVNLLPEDERMNVKLNVPLFDWVIENLFRNAIDAIETSGSLEVQFGDKGKYAYIDVIDTGKGIPKSKLKTVFQPGYTSKKRGWGLGLSLAKRIIEDYHKGKIFVRRSEVGKGTTFRILLPKA